MRVIIFVMDRSEGKPMTKDTRAIIIAVVMATVAVITVNKIDISELRVDMRELRGLLISHTSGHSHSSKVVSESEETK